MAAAHTVAAVRYLHACSHGRSPYCSCSAIPVAVDCLALCLTNPPGQRGNYANMATTNQHDSMTQFIPIFYCPRPNSSNLDGYTLRQDWSAHLYVCVNESPLPSPVDGVLARPFRHMTRQALAPCIMHWSVFADGHPACHDSSNDSRSSVLRLN